MIDPIIGIIKGMSEYDVNWPALRGESPNYLLVNLSIKPDIVRLAERIERHESA